MIIPKSQERAVSQPTLQQFTPNTGLKSVGNAIEGVMNARQEKQDREDVAAKNAELFNNKMQEKEAKVKLDDVLTVELSEQVTTLKNNVANGAMKAEDANKVLNEWSSKRYKELENDMPMHARHDLENHWSSNVNKNATGFLPLQFRADEQKGITIADRATEIATRMDREEGRAYLDKTLVDLNIPEVVKQQRVNTYNTSRDLIEVDGRITTALESKTVDDLKALVTDLDSGKYGYLDGQQAQQKKAQALSRIDALNKQIEVEENKRVTMAGKVHNDFKSQVLTGRALDDDYIQNVADAVKGTEHEAEFNFYKTQSANFQNFARLSTTEQLKLINEQRAKAKNSKTADAVNEEKILGVYESLQKEKTEVLKNNPNQAVREAGLQTHSLTGAELNNPKSFAEKAIENGVSQLALKDPNIAVKPIAAEDLPGAKKTFDGMKVDDKLTLIGDLIAQSKGVPNGAQIWGATLGQLGGGDQSYVMAGLARMNGYKSNKGEDVATAIVSGTQALKNKQMIMPKDDLLKSEFNKYVGNSVSGQTANMTFAAFKSIYAHITERDGYQHKDKDDFSRDIAKTALSMSTGGIYEQGVKYGNQKSWKVAKPYGMDDDKFEHHLDQSYRVISQKTNISVAELKDLRLRRADKRSAKGEIQYDLINERGAPLVVNGAVWRVNLNGVTK